MLVYTYDDSYFTSTRVSSIESIRHFFPLEYVALERNDVALVDELIRTDMNEPYSVFPKGFDFSNGKDHMEVLARTIDKYLDSRLETE